MWEQNIIKCNSLLQSGYDESPNYQRRGETLSLKHFNNTWDSHPIVLTSEKMWSVSPILD